MPTISGTVQSVDVRTGRTTAQIRTATSQTLSVFVDTLNPAPTGDPDYDAQVSTARKTALLIAAAWGLPVDVDVDAASVVNSVILKQP